MIAFRFLIASIVLVIAAAVPTTTQAVEVSDSLWVPSASGPPQVQVEVTTDIPSLHPVHFSRRCAPGIEFSDPSGSTRTECALYGQSGAILQATSGLLKINGTDAPLRYADGGSLAVDLLPDGAFIHYSCDGGYGCAARIDPTAPRYRFNNLTSRFEWTFARPTEPPLSAGGIDLRLYPISATVNKTGRYLVSVMSKRIVWIDRATGDVRQVSTAPEPGLGFSLDVPLAISPSGRYVAVGANSWGSTLRVFDMDTCSPDPRPFESTCASVNLDDLFNESKFGFYPGHVVRVDFYGESQITFAAKTSFLPGGSDTEFRQFLMTAGGAGPPEESGAFLGDSFASGEGAQSFADQPIVEGSELTWPGEDFVYLTGTDEYDLDSCEVLGIGGFLGAVKACKPINLCHVSAQAWPYRVASMLGLSSFSTFACSGAQTYNVRNVTQYEDTTVSTPGFPGSEPQSTSLSRFEPPPGQVFVQIGGNDAGFTNILAKCTLPPPGNCAGDPDLRREFALSIQNAFYLVRDTLAALKADTEHQSDIYLVGYPAIIDPDSSSACGNNVFLASEERAFSNDLLDYIEQMSMAAAASAGVNFISLADSIADHQLCDPTPWVNGLTEGNDLRESTAWGYGIGNESYHPRREAHVAFADAVIAATAPAGSGNPEPDPSVTAPPIPTWGTGSTSARSWTPEVDATPGAPTMPRVHADGLEPETSVTGYYESAPVPFVPEVADEDGELVFTPEPTSQLPPGQHTLHIWATAANQEELHARIPLLVPAEDGDADVDGIPDAEDGCPLIPAAQSAVQQDIDGDGVSDECDSSLIDGPAADPDSDGLTNEEEFAAGTDRENPDSDADGLGDGVDNCPSVSNGTQDDIDGDGIGDACDKLGISLAVLVEGTGTGTVASSPGLISCSPFCEDEFEEGAEVTLTASPQPGSLFVAWRKCDKGGANRRQCTVTMNEAKEVKAVFIAAHDLTLSKAADSVSGKVRSRPGGIVCLSACTAETTTFKEGRKVELLPVPSKHFHLAAWGGDCEGTGVCELTMGEDHEVTARFEEDPKFTLTLTKDGGGQGLIKSRPAGILCIYACSTVTASFYEGEEVLLEVTSVSKGSTFSGWAGGGCSGAGVCTVTASAVEAITATFE